MCINKYFIHLKWVKLLTGHLLQNINNEKLISISKVTICSFLEMLENKRKNI